MRRFFYLIFWVVVVGFSISDVQKEHIKLNWSFESNYLDVNSKISFENAEFTGNDQIPVFSKRIDLKKQNQDLRLVIENVTFKELANEPDYLNNIQLGEQLEVEKKILKSGSSSFIEFQIIPFVKRNSKIFIAENFDLKQIPVHLKSSELENHTWETSSVLNSGKWIKIKTAGKGIYKIPYSKLNEWGFSNPSNVNVFGCGGTILSENPGEITYDDLVQNSVWYAKNNDTDCLFFYEPGNIEWMLDGSNSYFEHEINNYSDNGFYFLTEDVGSKKNIELIPEIEEDVTHEVSDFDAYDLYEQDLENLIFSGKQWFGQKFINGTTKTYSFDLTNLVNSDVSVRVRAAGRSYQASEMPVTVNTEKLGALSFTKVSTDDNVSLYADLRSNRFSKVIDGNELNVVLKYFAVDGSTIDDNAESWLDFIEINYRKKISVETAPLFFREKSSVGNGNVAEFTILNSSSSVKMFDVTDINNVKEVVLNTSGTESKAKCDANNLHEYVVFNSNGNFPEPELSGEVSNQNLHGIDTPEFLIVSHPNFLNSANTLAGFHRSYDGMSVEVVNSENVYNEFSSGLKSATGIRNFIKMLYDRNDGLKYVLLLGDGSYDNKKINAESASFIPTFQSENSLNPVASFVTDDYFVMLDENESVYSGAIDLGIGRIPVSTSYDAELVVNKVLNYYNPEALGNWRNIICFIADDQDEGQPMHLTDSEKLAQIVNTDHTEFVTEKIYLDAYKQESLAGVERYPDVTDAINKRVKDGVLVLNYVGHANDRFLADEHVLDVSNINSWSNSNTLPIFVTATCEFSRFDADETSAGEYVLLNPNGGGIGLFSTTRVVFAYSNFLLSRSFYNFIFEKDENGNHYRMGDIIRLAKINTINTTNKRNFSLLADPALKLSYPENKVQTTSINQQSASEKPDTISALQKITISGFIADNLGNKMPGFSGQITPTVYDKAVTMKTLGNGGEDPLEFSVQENIIYKGVAKVTNGEFTFSFVVPKDISYNLGKGKVIYYAENGEIDAHGAFENFVIGGNSENQIVDNLGPKIELYMDSESFVSGDKTSKNPSLLAFLSDENGINTVGTGIGHDITAVLDNDYSNVVVLNKYYQSNTDDYKSGVLQYPFKDLAVGEHKLVLKAWDVANNSTEVEIDFVVSGEFTISAISNYPNPVIDYTFFTFEHNQSDATLDVIVEIFDQSGSRIDFFTTSVGSDGKKSNPVRWDPNEVNGYLRGGIYLYRITAQNNDNVLASKSGKFVLVH